MNTIQASELVLQEGVKLLRRRAENAIDENGKPVPQYDVKDAFTASAIMACYNALNDDNKKKAPRICVEKWADFAFSHVK